MGFFFLAIVVMFNKDLSVDIPRQASIEVPVQNAIRGLKYRISLFEDHLSYQV